MLKSKQNPEYFTVRNLQKEIKRILAIVPDSELNKVVIPKDPKDQTKDLNYARVFFDLVQLNQIDAIKEALEMDETFNKNVEVLTFKPPPKNVTMLYVKGFAKPGDNLDKMDTELKEFFQKLNPTW
jgi:hypothetical protein